SAGAYLLTQLLGGYGGFDRLVRANPPLSTERRCRENASCAKHPPSEALCETYSSSMPFERRAPAARRERALYSASTRRSSSRRRWSTSPANRASGVRTSRTS